MITLCGQIFVSRTETLHPRRVSTQNVPCVRSKRPAWQLELEKEHHLSTRRRASSSQHLLFPSQREKTRKQKTISMLVACGGQAGLCTWFQVWRSTGRRLWDCIDTALGNDTDASKLTRLYGQADFQGPPLELVEMVRRAIREEFALNQSQCPSRPLGCPGTFEWISFVE